MLYAAKIEEEASVPVGQLGIQFTPNGVAIAQTIDTESREPTLLKSSFISCTEDNHAMQLRTFVETQGLRGLEANVALTLAQYQQVLVDAPEVVGDEMREAMRWKVRDLIEMPIDDAKIDYFEVPALRASDNAKMVYAVATPKKILTEITEKIQNSGLTIWSIDIPELLIRNVVRLGGYETYNMVVVSLGRTSGKTIHIRDGQVYISRQLDLNLESFFEEQTVDSERNRPIFDELLMELQRSIDFCCSHLRQPPPTTIMFTPLLQPVSGLLEGTKEALGLETGLFDINQMIKRKKFEVSMQERIFQAFAASLRTDEDEEAEDDQTKDKEKLA